MRSAGFTMIEMIAVVLLLGLLAGATALSLTQSAQRATRQDVVERVAHADAMTRMTARRLGRAYLLRFDLEDQRIERDTASGGREMPEAQTTGIPSDYRIEGVMVAAAGGVAGKVATQEMTRGLVEVTVSAQGMSQSYAVRVTSARRRDESGPTDPPDSIWMVFSGLTGQMIEFNDEDTDAQGQVERLFASIARGGTDAD